MTVEDLMAELQKMIEYNPAVKYMEVYLDGDTELPARSADVEPDYSGHEIVMIN
jgi:hypothetical protein